MIRFYAGGHPISRTAAVIAPGALVMALIYAWGPLSGLHINPVVTLAFFGALVAVMLISLVRGLPGRADREAAEGDVLPS